MLILGLVGSFPLWVGLGRIKEIGPTSNSAAMRFTVDDKQLIKWMRVSKNYIAKLLFNMLFDRRCAEDIDQKISARYLTLLIFAMGWAVCGRPQPEHESVMSLSPLNVLNIFMHHKW